MTKNQVNTLDNLNFIFNGHPLNVIDRDGEPWFVATEVGRALGLKGNGNTITAELDPDEKGAVSNSTLGGKQRVMCVSESGLWAMVIKCRKPEAKAFRKYVTGEVLPSIRKHGFYVRPDKLNEFMSVLEAARCVSRHVKTIYNRIYRTGEIETRQGERGIEVNMSSLLEHLRENPIRRHSRTIQPQAGEVTVNVTALSCANQILVNALVEQLAEAQGSAT